MRLGEAGAVNRPYKILQDDQYIRACSYSMYVFLYDTVVRKEYRENGLKVGISLPRQALSLVIAQRLDMQLIMGAASRHNSDFQLALMTRLPIVHQRIHTRPGLLNRPLLEVCVEETSGQHLTLFVTHLTAAFSRFRTGDYIRRREIQEIIRIMAPLREQGMPHLLMGDFNSLAPGDAFVASNLLRYIVGLDERRHADHEGDGNPHLDFVVPARLRFLSPLLRTIPDNSLLRTGFDALAYCYDARDTVRLLRRTGYVDNYRHMHPQARGFTCPAALPAGRIDYIFADPIMAQRLHN